MQDKTVGIWVAFHKKNKKIKKYISEKYIIYDKTFDKRCTRAKKQTIQIKSQFFIFNVDSCSDGAWSMQRIKNIFFYDRFYERRTRRTPLDRLLCRVGSGTSLYIIITEDRIHFDAGDIAYRVNRARYSARFLVIH